MGAGADGSGRVTGILVRRGRHGGGASLDAWVQKAWDKNWTAERQITLNGGRYRKRSASPRLPYLRASITHCACARVTRCLRRR